MESTGKIDESIRCSQVGGSSTGGSPSTQVGLADLHLFRVPIVYTNADAEPHVSRPLLRGNG